VDLSGVIFVVLALVWAAVLVPKALRHHDEVAKTRAVDRFSSSTRVLARREPVDGRQARLVVTPRATADQPTAPPPDRAAARRRAARAAARRRRRILGLLVLSLVGVAVAAGLAMLPLWSVAVPAGLTVAYLLLCRVLVRRENSAWDRETRAATAPAGSRAGSPAAGLPPIETTENIAPQAGGQAETAAAAHAEDRNAQGFAEFSAQEDTVTIRREDVESAGSLWDPLPITLPTYVGKPRARRTVRTIDLTTADVSSSGRETTEGRPVAEAELVEEPPRAVGS
jgi:hypothetical protein